MDLSNLIAGLQATGAYPHPVDAVELRQTHISAVFLAGPYVYKVKKPVNLGFLDFSTLEKRRHFCGEEVRLNRRLAPDVYLGVVPIVETGGGLRVEGAGEPIEWAVKMQRLPDEATLERRLGRGEIDVGRMANLAGVIARFHASAERSAHIAGFGSFRVVAGNARENFTQARPEVGKTVHAEVFSRCQMLSERRLAELRDLIERRAGDGVPCDTHGDLHLDHVYLFPERPPPDDLAIIDCIEFNERFRFADPVADVAFLIMDLKYHARPDLARAVAEAYFHAAHDADGRRLLPFYTAYRAVVRAKVEGFKLREAEVPRSEKAGDLAHARAHWLLALGELEEPAGRPALVLIGGLPGTGKSALAQALAAVAGLSVVRSDVIRKELAGVQPEARCGAEPGGGIYSAEWTQRTYAECLRRADALLFEGKRVVVDATFREDERRLAFLNAARRLCVPALWLECRTEAETARRRLEARRGDASDADWSVYQHAAASWQPPGPLSAATQRVVDTTGPLPQTVQQALEHMRANGIG